MREEVEEQVRLEYEAKLGIRLPAGKHSVRDAAITAAQHAQAAASGGGGGVPFARMQAGSIAGQWDESKRKQRFAQLAELDDFVATHRKEVLDRLQARMPVILQVLTFWYQQKTRSAWEVWGDAVVVGRNEELLLRAEAEEQKVMEEAEELAVAARLRAEDEAAVFRRQADELADLARAQAREQVAASRKRAANAIAKANAAKARAASSLNDDD
jgi:hypothetical protein